MATASPSPTPNPNAMKFTLDVSLASAINVTSAQAASGDKFAEAVFSAGGVASLFGVNDFVTVTREPDADWGPIVAAVEAAAAAYL
jgi:scaffold Nfu/NifU family protein